MMMSTNSLFVWQVRVWLGALAAVLVLANAGHSVADKGPQQLGASDHQPCLAARAPIMHAHLTATRAAQVDRKCREAKIVEDASAPGRPVGG